MINSSQKKISQGKNTPKHMYPRF